MEEMKKNEETVSEETAEIKEADVKKLEEKLQKAESDLAAAIRSGSCGRHVTPDQAVSRARPF